MTTTKKERIASIEDIIKLFEAMTEFKIDLIEVDGARIVKSRHESPPISSSPLDDEHLFQD